MRLVARIPAARGRVVSITVALIYDGDTDATPIDITDIQLQPGDPSGVVPHPSDIVTRAGESSWRNGVVPRTTDEVILLANTDLATPTRVIVEPSEPGSVRVGSYRFGRIDSTAQVDGLAGTASHGWGRPPVLTERSDGRVAVDIEQPIHLAVGWQERY